MWNRNKIAFCLFSYDGKYYLGRFPPAPRLIRGVCEERRDFFEALQQRLEMLRNIFLLDVISFLLQKYSLLKLQFFAMLHRKSCSPKPVKMHRGLCCKRNSSNYRHWMLRFLSCGNIESDSAQHRISRRAHDLISEILSIMSEDHPVHPEPFFSNRTLSSASVTSIPMSFPNKRADARDDSKDFEIRNWGIDEQDAQSSYVSTSRRTCSNSQEFERVNPGHAPAWRCLRFDRASKAVGTAVCVFQEIRILLCF
jgi:hypothetical protein